ncbi:hypothetical protein HZA56_21295 [Candidatus Poribacteria bacterium]|nr:hypothetical protein [Candidatus Poribacteria bacterium]
MGLKIQRTFTSLLPVDEGRKGSCRRCGQCCKLAFDCPFYDGKGCVVYSLRPPQCRKYPRTKEESIVQDCGFIFGD